MAGPSTALNRCVTCSVACPLSAEALECYLCCGHLCRACLFRGVCLCADCVQHMNPLLARVPTMDIFYNNMSEEPLQRTRWVVELADALTECHICRSIGFFVPCSSCSKPTCVGCQQSPSEQCDQQCSKTGGYSLYDIRFRSLSKIPKVALIKGKHNLELVV
jgi:hypothetical protein